MVMGGPTFGVLGRLSVRPEICFIWAQDVPLPSFPSYHDHLFPPPQTKAMQHAPSSASLLRQPFLPLQPNDRSRQYSAPSSTSLDASIWAPHAQIPGGTWPKDVQDVSDGATFSARLPDYPHISSGALSTFEDRVPPNGASDFSVRGGLTKPVAIGAIGEGRARDSQLNRETEVSVHIDNTRLRGKFWTHIGTPCSHILTYLYFQFSMLSSSFARWTSIRRFWMVHCLRLSI